MTSQERAEILRHLGYTVLDDSQVEIRDSVYGKYAVLKQPDAEAIGAVNLASPENIEESFRYAHQRGGTHWEAYRNYVATPQDKVCVHVDLPLRIEGTYVATSDGTVTVFSVGGRSQQEYWTLKGGFARRHEYDLYSGNTIYLGSRRLFRGLAQIGSPGSYERARFMAAFSSYVRQRAAMRDDFEPRQRADLVGQRMEDLLGYTPHGLRRQSPGYIQWRTGYVTTGEHFVELKQKTKHIGILIANPDTDVYELRDELTSLLEHSGAAHGHRHHIVDAWNKVHPLDEQLMFCTCGHIEVEGSVTRSSGSTICEHCIETRQYVMAEDLDEYIPRGDAYEHDDGLWYSYQERDEDDDYGSNIKNYSTDVREYVSADASIKPSAYGEFLMGIELEVEASEGYDRGDAARHTLRHLGEDYIVLKNDGSLGDDGFEIVTAPRGLKEHVKRFGEWEPHRDLRAWDAGCCGMHVHISSQAFTQATLGKFIEFINSKQNDAFIRSIAGRHPATDGQAQSYCQRDGCTPGNPKKTLCDKSADRYFMVNTTNLTHKEAERLGLGSAHTDGRSQNTIELRVFRASLKKSRLLAQIEFTHAAVMFCRWSSMRELDQAHFVEWLRGMAGVYPNLAKWFGVKANTDKVEEQPKARQGAEV